MRQNVGMMIGSKMTRLKWWQGILLFWFSAHVVALGALAVMVGLTSAALAGPATCRQAPCVLNGGGTEEFKWLGWYIQNGGQGLVTVPYTGDEARLVRASFSMTKRAAGICTQMCSVVAGLALKGRTITISEETVFCFCQPIGSVAEGRWETWQAQMPAAWVAAMRTNKPFHWPLRAGEGMAASGVDL